MYPEEHQRLSDLAKEAGISLSEAFRRGADLYLSRPPESEVAVYAQGYADAARVRDEADDDALLTELQALAGRIDRRIRRGS